MPRKRKTNQEFGFPERNRPDHIRNEIINTLAEATKALSFQEVFEIVEPRLKANHKQYATLGEENMRLRVYDKLNPLVLKGFVIRDENRKYRKKPNILDALTPKA